MSKKINVAIVCGGKSAEHEISLISAKFILDNINRKKFDVQTIGIDRKGRWFLYKNEKYLSGGTDPKKVKLKKDGIQLSVIPTDRGSRLFAIAKPRIKIKTPDIFFPVLHGPFGEDGTIQGLFDILGLPYVGASVLGSAVCMDKDVSKRLLKAAGIPVTNFLAVKKAYYNELKSHILKFVRNTFIPPIFIKPANTGSSVGISMVKHKKNIEAAINRAFRFDTKILIEQGIIGREIECAVLGNDNPQASLIGEIIPKDKFYSYKAKYIDQDGAKLIAPAKLKPGLVKKIQKLAISAYKVLCCEGMARVDMFIHKKTGRILLNELNTIPGFTSISMYPKLWSLTNISYPKLIEKLILLAIKRHREKEKIRND